MKRYSKIYGLMACFAIGLTGCGTFDVRSSQDLSSVPVSPVAVIPFDTLSGEVNAGLIMTDLIRSEVVRQTDLTLVAADHVSRELEDLAGQVLSPAEIGGKVNAKTLITGEVLEYRYKRGVGEEPSIGVIVRLVDVDSGKILWQATCTRIGRYSWFTEDSLSRLAHAISSDIITSFAEHLEE